MPRKQPAGTIKKVSLGQGGYMQQRIFKPLTSTDLDLFRPNGLWLCRIKTRRKYSGRDQSLLTSSVSSGAGRKKKGDIK